MAFKYQWKKNPYGITEKDWEATLQLKICYPYMKSWQYYLREKYFLDRLLSAYLWLFIFEFQKDKNDFN